VAIPMGIITIWNGDSSSIPSGWAVCDGASGTPDLRNLFVYGAFSDVEVNSTGGGSHTHTSGLSINSGGGHTHALSGTSGAAATTTCVATTGAYNIAGAHTHTMSGTAATANSHTHSIGSSDSFDNVPEYVKLYYIMKL
jgi:microcystin-dependent protein